MSLRNRHVQRPLRLRLAAIAVLVASLTVGCGKDAGSPAAESTVISGQRITVVLPSYVNLPPELIHKFEQQTGVTVDFNVSSWDNIRDRIATAGAAGQAIGDVTEVDWSWIGQLAAAKWYSPIEARLGPGVRDDLLNSAAFSNGGHMYAACYSNDARIGLYNKEMLSRAGIATAPTTVSQLSEDVAKIVESGASKHPLALTLSATEGAVTEWNLLTVAMGGHLLDDKGKAAFRGTGSPGYQALNFEVQALKSGWADPASVSNDDQKTDSLFATGEAAFQIAGNPGELSGLNDPAQSAIAGKAAYFLEPGVSGPGNTFGLPEGVGIPVASKHKAAAAAFINWMMDPATQVEIFAATGTLPCRTSTVQSLVSKGDLPGGSVINDQLARLVPLFAGGAPAWYPKFSADAAAAINAAATGNLSVDRAITRMADKVDQLVSGR
jgi:multiple sugar transport system substrate-binding protein